MELHELDKLVNDPRNCYKGNQYRGLTCYQLTPIRLLLSVIGAFTINGLYDPMASFIDLGAGYGCLIEYLRQNKIFKKVEGVEFDQNKVDIGLKHFPDLSLFQGDVSEATTLSNDIIYTFNICHNKEEVFGNLLTSMNKGQIFIESNDDMHTIEVMMERRAFSKIIKYNLSDITIGVK